MSYLLKIIVAMCLYILKLIITVDSLSYSVYGKVDARLQPTM